MLAATGAAATAFESERDALAVVVNVIHGLPCQTPADRRRVELALDALTGVSSSHVVPVIDYGIDDGGTGGALAWIVRPRVSDAQSLDVALASGSRIDRGWAHSVLLDVARGLADLHAAGLLHGAMTAGKVLVNPAGDARLIDFEISKIIEDAGAAHGRDDAAGWMAPEQLAGPTRPAADLWAMGVLAHRLLTGRHPIASHVRQSPTGLESAVASASLVGRDVPAPYDELLRALLRKIPNGRPGRAKDIVQWLEAPGTVSLDPPAPRRRPGVRLVVRDREETNAIEIGPVDELDVVAVDAVPPARGDVARLRCAATRLGADLAFEPHMHDRGPAELFDLVATDDLDGDLRVRNWFKRTAGGVHDVVLLPFDDASAVGIDAAVAVLRLGARRQHRDERPVVGTIHCSADLLRVPSQAVRLIAACATVEVGGWRLLVDGIEPGCSLASLRAVREAAQALAVGGLPVWVRAAGVARWAFLPTPGVGLLYRAGRGLWTRPGGGGSDADERVEIEAFAGPVPREFAELIAIVRPDLVRCSCSVCCGRRGLPPTGTHTIVHNVAVLGRLMAAARDTYAAIETMRVARLLRAEVGAEIGWHGETGDLQRVERLLLERDASRTPSELTLAA